MSYQMNLLGTANATSSPASQDGASRSKLLVGPKIYPYGRDHVHANLSAEQAKEKGLLMSGIFGRHGTGSLQYVSLGAYLASKLPHRMGCIGLILYSMTWRELDTPSGRILSQLAASARHMYDRESGSLRCGWPTVKHRDGRTLHGAQDRPSRQGGPSLVHLVMYQFALDILAGWATPTATDAKRGVKPPRPWDSGIPLSQQAGMIMIGSNAPTGNFVQLNPELIRWLMGYPEEHLRLLLTAMR